jgi:hypothetical protein
MEVLEAQLLHWQATGWIEQVGRLPDAAQGDSVFAVHAPELRKELASRLDAIGKSAVVMAPQQANSLLREALRSEGKTQHDAPGAVKQADAGTSNPHDTADELPTTTPVETGWDTDDALATHLLDNDLTQVLQQAAELETELEGVLATADDGTPWHDEGLDAAAPDAFDAPFEAAERLDVGDLHAAFNNWDRYEPGSPAADELDAPTRVASEPPARKTRRAIAVGSDAMGRAQTPAPARAIDSATLAMSRVETCLGELKNAMVAMTKRPEPAAIDLRPIVDAVQSGFEGASRQSAAIGSTVLSLAERLGRSAQQDEPGVSRAVGGAMERSTGARNHRGAPQLVAARGDRLPISLLAMAVLMLCWSVLLWFKTGSPNVAIGTIVGAGVVACCLLAARRNRT